MKKALEMERSEEKAELDELLSTLSAPEAQSFGLSLLSLRVWERSVALFGRTKYTLGKPRSKRGGNEEATTEVDESGSGGDSDLLPLPSCHRFRVGSEV